MNNSGDIQESIPEGNPIFLFPYDADKLPYEQGVALKQLLDFDSDELKKMLESVLKKPRGPGLTFPEDMPEHTRELLRSRIAPRFIDLALRAHNPRPGDELTDTYSKEQWFNILRNAYWMRINIEQQNEPSIHEMVTRKPDIENDMSRIIKVHAISPEGFKDLHERLIKYLKQQEAKRDTKLPSHEDFEKALAHANFYKEPIENLQAWLPLFDQVARALEGTE